MGQHHARIYNELENCELVGVCDLDPVRAQEIATMYGCRVFETPQALGEACDAVSVVVPTDKHTSVALTLLNEKCHLLIEKPICSSLQEAEEILKLAKEKDRIVQVGHVEHYNPVATFLEQVIHEPRFITADRLAPFNPRGTEVGVVLDLMIHDISMILNLVRSPIAKIDCIGVNVLTQTEDIANARITFESGCVANINTSRVSLKKIREIRIFQPYTYLSLDFMNQKGHLLKKEVMGLQKEDIPIEKAEPLRVEIGAFIDCVYKTAEPKVGGQLGRMALEVAIEITDNIRAQNLRV